MVNLKKIIKMNLLLYDRTSKDLVYWLNLHQSAFSIKLNNNTFNDNEKRKINEFFMQFNNKGLLNFDTEEVKKWNI